jgi:hypothetical protein
MVLLEAVAARQIAVDSRVSWADMRQLNWRSAFVDDESTHS